MHNLGTRVYSAKLRKVILNEVCEVKNLLDFLLVSDQGMSIGVAFSEFCKGLLTRGRAVRASFATPRSALKVSEKSRLYRANLTARPA